MVAKSSSMETDDFVEPDVDLRGVALIFLGGVGGTEDEGIPNSESVGVTQPLVVSISPSTLRAFFFTAI